MIVLPTYDVKQMTRRGSSLSRQVSRQMRLLRSGNLRNLLRQKCTGRFKKAILFQNVDESWSSKCCGYCGECNRLLGGKKVNSCRSCGQSECRDGGAARKIFIKFFLWYYKKAAQVSESAGMCAQNLKHFQVSLC